MLRVPTARSSAKRPAFPRKTRGDALMMTSSDTPKLPCQVLLVDYEHIHPATRQLGQKLRSIHTRGSAARSMESAPCWYQ